MRINLTEFFTSYNPAWDNYEIHSRKNTDGVLQYATSICYISKEVGTISTPHMQLTSEEAQNLLQSLWNTGIRPKQEGTLGQLAAVNYHLEDMRKLVFSKRE